MDDFDFSEFLNFNSNNQFEEIKENTIFEAEQNINSKLNKKRKINETTYEYLQDDTIKNIKKEYSAISYNLNLKVKNTNMIEIENKIFQILKEDDGFDMQIMVFYFNLLNFQKFIIKKNTDDIINKIKNLDVDNKKKNIINEFLEIKNIDQSILFLTKYKK